MENIITKSQTNLGARTNGITFGKSCYTLALAVVNVSTVGLQRSRNWCCQVEWARPSRPPSSSTPTSWRGTRTFSSCSSKTNTAFKCFSQLIDGTKSQLEASYFSCCFFLTMIRNENVKIPEGIEHLKVLFILKGTSVTVWFRFAVELVAVTVALFILLKGFRIESQWFSLLKEAAFITGHVEENVWFIQSTSGRRFLKT